MKAGKLDVNLHGQEMIAMKYSFASDEYIQYILDTYSAMIIKLAFTYVKNTADAEDIAQEVFVSLIKRNEAFDSTEHEKAWLLRVTINKAKNHLKSGWVKHTAELDESLSYTDKEDSDVLSYVMALPEKYRTTIHLFYYEGYSIIEIAQILGKSTGTVGTWLSRGRSMLKSEMIGGFDNE